MKNDQLFIIKVGGNIIDHTEKLSAFLNHFSSLPQKKILIHGGGKIASDIGDKLGIKSNYINGRRITDTETIDLVTMVYAGLINKKIVAKLQALNVNAIGLTGADGNCIPAIKRPIKDIDFGWVGDIQEGKINISQWKLFIENDLVPIVAPLTHDQKGHLLNTNADTVASAIAVALSKSYEVTLVYCFERKGVLDDIKNENSIIKNINRESFNQLQKENKVAEGILPKIENALSAIDAGVSKIIIGHSDDIIANVNGESKGTTIYK